MLRCGLEGRTGRGWFVYEYLPILRIALIAALTCLGYEAAAQSVPPAVGSDLLRSCNALVEFAGQGGQVTVDATSCAAYLKGLRDGVDAPSQARSAADRPFCAGGAGLDEMALAVVKHLQERADSGRRHATSEALAALGRAFPCAKK